MNATAEISNFSLLWLILMVLPVLIINRKIGIDVNKKLIIAIIRMIIQLSVVGIFLVYIFKLNNTLVNIFYMLFMMILAAVTTINNSKLKFNKFFGIILVSFVLPTVIILWAFNRLVINLNNIYDARYLVSIGGMLLGNSINGIIVGINDYFNNLKNNEKKYLYALSLSTSKFEALKPFLKSAMKSAVNPHIASIEITGLVALPGMMTGQILGGSVPITAVKYQIAIMIAILAARCICTFLALYLISVKAFDDYDLLIM